MRSIIHAMHVSAGGIYYRPRYWAGTQVDLRLIEPCFLSRNYRIFFFLQLVAAFILSTGK
jgi:hypothetical protein